MSEFNWDKWLEEKRRENAEYGGGIGIKCICQNCGYKMKIRLKRGCSVKATICPKCGKQSFKRKPFTSCSESGEVK